jgi:hypothetical protein
MVGYATMLNYGLCIDRHIANPAYKLAKFKHFYGGLRNQLKLSVVYRSPNGLLTQPTN